ncbi:MAG: DUF4863 domain-containing protein [Deltaproteobacteria bacterium]|nr:DUF4863 domain-containing protein [Deltaproteobacteria bacterium]
MSDRETAIQILQPILDVLRNIDASAQDATARVTQALPLDDPRIVAARKLVTEGLKDGWIAPREAGGIRFGRVAKPSEDLHGFSIDAVEMDCAGPGHVHPNGEFDLSFALEGAPMFEGHGEGWVVLPPGSWHVPTVTGGRMGILYFLPGGAIEFGPKPN